MQFRSSMKYISKPRKSHSKPSVMRKLQSHFLYGGFSFITQYTVTMIILNFILTTEDSNKGNNHRCFYIMIHIRK